MADLRCLRVATRVSKFRRRPFVRLMPRSGFANDEALDEELDDGERSTAEQQDVSTTPKIVDKMATTAVATAATTTTSAETSSSQFLATDDLIRELIDCVREQEVLYKPTHKHFRHLIKKHQAYLSVANLLKSKGYADVTGSSSKSSWRHARANSTVLQSCLQLSALRYATNSLC